jgi:hypothetical protein
VIFNEQVTGRPGVVAPSLRRRVSAYTRHDRARAFKIGITNHPERRFRQSYAGTYDDMIVIYQSSSRQFIREMERDLIEYNRVLCNNLIGGGGGRATTGPFYLYIVRER